MAIGRHRCSCSVIANVHLEGSGLVGKADRHFAVEILVGRLFRHGLDLLPAHRWAAQKRRSSAGGTNTRLRRIMIGLCLIWPAFVAAFVA